jgi:SAM-dependent methyltransferase
LSRATHESADMTSGRSLDDLLTEALRHPAQGWDFRWLRDLDRFEESPLPWEYNELVQSRKRTSPDLLDLGTGGGERLATFAPHPVRTVATESYAPNVHVASRNLISFGIQVIRVSSVPGNDHQSGDDKVPGLPFRDESFHLVINRNEAFVAREVARVLARRGTFLTEQSGTAEIPPILMLLGLPIPLTEGRPWDLAFAKEQVARAGLTVTRSGAADFEMLFHDVGALVWYLRMAPWTAPGFSPERHRLQPEELHSRVQREGPLRIPRDAFWLEAVK